MDGTADPLAGALARAAEHAIAYRRDTASRLHRPETGYAEMRRVFSGPTPEDGAGAAAVIDQLAGLAAPGLGASVGPRFFAWVIGASHPVGVAADWLTSAWGQNAAGHSSSPAAAACEEEAARWLLDLLDLPAESSVGFATGATAANLVCLAAARGEVLRRVGWDVEADGLFGAPPIAVLIGEDAHVSVFSALQYLGLGRERVVRVATDAAGRMKADAFAAAADAAHGPMIAIAQAGQINTGSFDPFAQLAEVARRRGAWLHVDGAFGLWARACPGRSHLAAGIEGADSWATDGHKWLQTPYDTGYAIVRDAEAHRRAMAVDASYLVVAGQGERRPSDFVPELSRRARGFATWAMIRALGRRGIAQMVDRHCRLAQRLAARLAAERGVALLNEVELNQAIVRFGTAAPPEEGDRLTTAVIERVQADGTCYLGGASWRGRWVMRLSVSGWPTTEADIDLSAEAILSAWRAVRAG